MMIQNSNKSVDGFLVNDCIKSAHSTLFVSMMSCMILGDTFVLKL